MGLHRTWCQLPCGNPNRPGLRNDGETGLSSSGGSAQDLAVLAHKTSKTTFALLVGED